MKQPIDTRRGKPSPGGLKDRGALTKKYIDEQNVDVRHMRREIVRLSEEVLELMGRIEALEKQVQAQSNVTMVYHEMPLDGGGTA